MRRLTRRARLGIGHGRAVSGTLDGRRLFGGTVDEFFKGGRS